MWMDSFYFQLWAGMCSTEWLAFMLKRARKTHSVGEFLRGDKRFHLLKWISDAASHQRTTVRSGESRSEQQQKTNVKIDIAFLRIRSRDATAAVVLPCELSFHYSWRIWYAKNWIHGKWKCSVTCERINFDPFIIYIRLRRNVEDLLIQPKITRCE